MLGKEYGYTPSQIDEFSIHYTLTSYYSIIADQYIELISKIKND
jgi:hypothetical protein